MKRLLSGAAALLLLSSLPSFPAVPWKDGETLSYRVRWGVVPAARGVLSARAEGPGRWRFTLDLRSLGMTEAAYPIRDQVRSLVEAEPWRSLEYAEDRTENGHRKQQLTQVDYGRRSGLSRDPGSAAAPVSFPVAASSLEDLESMLYAVRRIDWKGAPVRPFLIYDGAEIHRGEVSFLRRETISDPRDGKAVPCLVVHIRPVYGDPKRDSKGYGTTLWMTDDAARTPLRADLKAKFGTFTLELEKPSG